MSDDIYTKEWAEANPEIQIEFLNLELNDEIGSDEENNADVVYTRTAPIIIFTKELVDVPGYDRYSRRWGKPLANGVAPDWRQVIVNGPRCPVCRAWTMLGMVPDYNIMELRGLIAWSLVCRCGLYETHYKDRRKEKFTIRETYERIGYRQFHWHHLTEDKDPGYLSNPARTRAVEEARLLLNDWDAVEFHCTWYLGCRTDDVARTVYADWLADKGYTEQEKGVREWKDQPQS